MMDSWWNGMGLPRAGCARTVRARPLPRPPARTPQHAHMPRHDRAAGARAWVARSWRALLSETCATALLVWLGVASALPAQPLAHVALAFGCVVTGCCAAFGRASGAHMNPAVTLAAALAGRLAPAAAAAYALAQLLGAVLGFAALQATLSAPAPLGLTLPAPAVGPLAGAALEAALTGLLALACCEAWAARPDAALPVKLGLLVAGLVFAGGPATGASLNPARSFAPALLHGRWEQHWVYWVGPLGGAALAALLHRVLQPARAAQAEAEAEAVPLDDKP